MIRKNKIILIILIAGMMASVNIAQTKLAQTGFNFLDVSSDARTNGMGDAATSLTGYSGALFHNPAGMADVTSFASATFSMNKWIADINHLNASLVLAPWDGDYGVVGFSMQSVDYGELQGTMVSMDGSDYYDTGLFSPTAMAIGLGYAKMLNDKFSVGGQVRYVYQKLGQSEIPDGVGTKMKDNEASALAFDFGTVYRTGFKSIAFGMSVRNYSQEVKFEEESFQLPLIFTLGISANVFDFFEMPGPEQDLLLSIDTTHPRSHPEQVKIGLEYTFRKMITLRGGHISGNSEDNFTFGFGVAFMGAEVDYSYTPFGVFNEVQRFTARFSF